MLRSASKKGSLSDHHRPAHRRRPTDGTVELPAELFDVTAHPADPSGGRGPARRCAAGHPLTKTRGDVRGGGKKPYRQKGTGRARQGSIRRRSTPAVASPRPAPPRLRQRTPKKMIAAACASALRPGPDGRIYVVADLVPGDVPSTKTALSALSAITSTDKVLVVIPR